MNTIDECVIPRNLIKYCKNKTGKRKVYKYYYIPEKKEVPACYITNIKKLVPEVDELPFTPVKEEISRPANHNSHHDLIEWLESLFFDGMSNAQLRKGCASRLKEEVAGTALWIDGKYTRNESKELLKSVGITDKRSFRSWIRNNHPDKGGDTTECAIIMKAGEDMGYKNNN